MKPENMVQIMGRLGQDPENRTKDGGATCVTFSVAVERDLQFDDAGNIIRDESGNAKTYGTDWIRCTAWRNRGNRILEKLGKGDRVIIHGELRVNSFQNENGEKRSFTDVHVDTYRILQKSNSGNQNAPDPQETPGPQQQPAPAPGPANDAPPGDEF